ncbi:MAG: DUF4038 domain-containing protein [SAR202 cluster bacterium]|jgi:hypothetical protein|nr:DUF4038 domain-containing protein [SAR202 cluster bacterium]
MSTTVQNHVSELVLTSSKVYADPFNDVEVSAVFTEPDGVTRTVPAFWAGDQVWKVRYASPLVGRHAYQAICSDHSNSSLHGCTGTVEVKEYDGANTVLRHGPLCVSKDGRHLQHHDGTPFFWLGDTWWMGLCERLGWPEGFQQLIADRVEKGFTLIQIVAGLYPDMRPFDERGRNEAGFPWEEDWSRIRPEYFDMADRRITHLVDNGLVPCIVGCWGYYMEFAGKEVLKKHWRYLVARWGAYPIVWCVAGEALMFWYLHQFDNENERNAFHDKTRTDWIEVTRYLRLVDPWHRPVTAHPGGRGAREMLTDELVEIEMLQTGHTGHASLPNTVSQVTESVAQKPFMPVINGEVSYEGIGGTCWQDVQRLMFWTCMLSGAAGHTYGANGLWQMGSEAEPYGPSPHGMAWGNTPWQAAAAMPGSRDVGIGRRILQRYDWWRLIPAPDLVQPRWTGDDYYGPYAATIPDHCLIVYFPKPSGNATVKLEPNTSYHAFFVNPATAEPYDLGCVKTDEDGMWTSPGRRPIFHDLVLVLEVLVDEN